MKRRLPVINYRKGQRYVLFAIISIALMVFVVTRSDVIRHYELTLEGDEIILTFEANDSEKYSCIATDSRPSLDDDGWIEASNNSCIFALDNQKDQFYLKNTSGLIIDAGNDYGLYSLDIHASEEEYYLALGETVPLPFEISVIGCYDGKDAKYSYDDEIIVINSDGSLETIGNGETELSCRIGNEKASVMIYVTDLLLPRTETVDLNKPYITKGLISKEENDLLDLFLSKRVEAKGYKTRAGVVEAARFLSLDFKYRIDYFFENGRLSVNKIDGEGRYYHSGLYLSEDRKSVITKSSKYGPAVWGESLYSTQTRKKSSNGLNCSGFVSWALVNGGFDPGDIGAVKLGTQDFQDIGHSLSCSSENLSMIKIGDLLHSTETGGHIAILIGKDDTYYYIAEALWYKPTGVVVSKMTFSNVIKRFDRIVDMSDFYCDDGDISDLWY